ncbi:MAG: GDP-mannose 4,6-dehydratase [Caulobacteraceae bacterium]
MTRTAFITGITGQDGAYLTALLLGKGYRVVGGHRRTSAQTFWRLAELGVLDHERLALLEHDLTDFSSSLRAISLAEPDEVYNLGAQSFVAVSFSQASTTAQISGLGAQTLMEAVRTIDPGIRFYQASSAEMFGKVQAVPQDEATPFYPRSPYGIAKLFAHWSAVNYREAHDMFVSSGILFNHESPLRGEEFVTRKIARAAARISLGRQGVVKLGNLDAKRDWGFAGEFVEGMWRMLQAGAPGTFVLATGATTTVRDFTALAFRAAGMEIAWEGAGLDEVGRCARSGREVVVVDKAFFRPAEVDALVGCPHKAEEVLGWRPKVSVSELAAMMVAADLAREGVERHAVREARETVDS